MRVLRYCPRFPEGILNMTFCPPRSYSVLLKGGTVTSMAAAGAAFGLFAYTKPSDSPDAIAVDRLDNEWRNERLICYKHNIASSGRMVFYRFRNIHGGRRLVMSGPGYRRLVAIGFGLRAEV